MCNDVPSASASAVATYFAAPYLWDTISQDLVIEDWSVWRVLRGVVLLSVLFFIMAMWASTIVRTYTSYTKGISYTENGVAAQKFRAEIEAGAETPGVLARNGMGFVEAKLRRDYLDGLRHREASAPALEGAQTPLPPVPTLGPNKKKKKGKARMKPPISIQLLLTTTLISMAVPLAHAGDGVSGPPHSISRPVKSDDDAIVAFVSPRGDDANTGTQDQPLRSVTAARNLVRARRSRSSTAVGATIWLRGGTYDMTRGRSLQLDARDSNVTWSAFDHEPVLLSGGLHVPEAQWKRPPASTLRRVPPASAQQVRQFDFTTTLAGASMGQLMGAGPPGTAAPWGVCANAQNREVFFRQPDGYSPGLLARYPNVMANGDWNWSIVAAPCGTSPLCQSNITAANESVARLQRWTEEPELWLQTYFEWDWANALVRVMGIEPAARRLMISPHTCAQHTPSPGSRWLAINALSELDAAGEYYLDRNGSKAVYFIPPNGADELVLSDASEIVNATNLSSVVFHGISMQFARGTIASCGPVGSDGGFCHGFMIKNSTVANAGEQAVAIDGYGCGLINVSVHSTGCQGVDVRGGDTASLTRGNSFVRGSTIANASRWHRTYTPHVRIGGVGNVYADNKLLNGPHSAMVGGCNDCVIDGNVFRRFLHETADSGAFYDGRTWVHRGNVISNNVFEEIRHSDPQRDNKGGMAAAVYFDDMLSGNSVINNTFRDCETGVLLGGGRHHTVRGNTFENVGDTQGGQSVWIDSRGLTGGPGANPNCRYNGTFHKELQAVKFTQPPWSTHYPEIPPIFARAGVGYSGCEPAGNRVLDNTCSGDPTTPGRFLVTSPRGATPIKTMEGWGDTFADNSNQSGCVLYA
jgi:hypothetical protein